MLPVNQKPIDGFRSDLHP